MIGVDTHIIDGKGIAARVRTEVADAVRSYTAATGQPPGLATVLVGDDPASEVYVRNKRRSAAAAGIADFHRHLPTGTCAHELADTVDQLADDNDVSGILVQLPLPDGLDPTDIIARIPWYKDVDGLTTTSAGLLARNLPGLRPCTPSGVLTLLDSIDIPIASAEVTIVGRSELVGRPLAQLLTQRDATVTVAHSKTRNLQEICYNADIVVAAAGRAGLIGRDDIRAGAVVIDVGIHRTTSGLVGDVRFPELLGHASHITPVPGGVGPMTIAELLRNTVTAAQLRTSN